MCSIRSHMASLPPLDSNMREVIVARGFIVLSASPEVSSAVSPASGPQGRSYPSHPDLQGGVQVGHRHVTQKLYTGGA